MQNFEQTRMQRGTVNYADTLEGMDSHYRYLWFCLINSSRESLMAFRLVPSLRYYKSLTIDVAREKLEKSSKSE